MLEIDLRTETLVLGGYVGNSSPNATDPSGLVGIPGTSIDPQAGEKQRRKKGQRKDRERKQKKK